MMDEEQKTMRVVVIIAALFLGFCLWNVRACTSKSNVIKLECLTTTDRDSRDCRFQ